MTIPETGELIGSTGFKLISSENSCACLDYWIGRQYWNRGYATESLAALLKFGFEDLGLHRIQGFSLSQNRRSIRVMSKAGLQKEGHLRQHIHCRSGFDDLEVYAMLRSEYFERKGAGDVKRAKVSPGSRDRVTSCVLRAPKSREMAR